MEMLILPALFVALWWMFWPAGVWEVLCLQVAYTPGGVLVTSLVYIFHICAAAFIGHSVIDFYGKYW